MKDAVRTFGDKLKRTKGVGFFYYSGHALQIRGNNFLVPIGATVRREHEVEHEAFDLKRITGLFSYADNELNIAVLDACRNNPYKGLFKDATQGLAGTTAPGGWLIGYATKSGDVAADDGSYASSLAKHLVTPGVAVESMFRQVAAEVQTLSRGEQTPWFQSSITQEFHIAGASSVQPVTPVGQRAVENEKALELSRDERRKIQTGLNVRSFDVGDPDGIFGMRTRAGISRFQASRNETENGYLTAEQAKSLLAGQTSVHGGFGGGDGNDGATRAAGTPFRDCAACPEMMRIPAGSFVMGSPESEPRRFSREGPQHRVSVPAFAMGRYGVTFAEWDECVADGGCNGYQPDDVGWGRGDRPVIKVSWGNAQSYIVWLNSKVPGTLYRLPSEAEWEHAARAGTTTPFWWCDTITPDQANYDGSYAYNGGKTGQYRSKTVPVGSFEANKFGLYNVHGNVWEWVQDSWHGTYDGAPTDGSIWSGGNSRRKVACGGSWSVNPRFFRSALCYYNAPDGQGHILRFRVARTLTP